MGPDFIMPNIFNIRHPYLKTQSQPPFVISQPFTFIPHFSYHDPLLVMQIYGQQEIDGANIAFDVLRREKKEDYYGANIVFYVFKMFVTNYNSL